MKKQNINIFENANMSPFIGRMYLPTKIFKMTEKRGFLFRHKYKSNLKGTFEFIQEIYLYFANGEENIVMEFKDLEIPILVSKEQFKRIKDYHVLEKKKPKKIQHFRKMERTGTVFQGEKTVITPKDRDLYFELPIVSDKEEADNELLKVNFSVKLINQKEYLEVSVDSKTPVSIISPSKIILQ